MATRQEAASRLECAFETLANPLRMRLFTQILREGCECSFGQDEAAVEMTCVKGLMEALDMPQSTVSTYLKDLELSGLIECKKVGRNLYCRPSRSVLLDMKVFVDGALKQIRYR